jgi:hypothetical protein
MVEFGGLCSVNTPIIILPKGNKENSKINFSVLMDFKELKKVWCFKQKFHKTIFGWLFCVQYGSKFKL